MYAGSKAVQTVQILEDLRLHVARENLQRAGQLPGVSGNHKNRPEKLVNIPWKPQDILAQVSGTSPGRTLSNGKVTKHTLQQQFQQFVLEVSRYGKCFGGKLCLAAQVE